MNKLYRYYSIDPDNLSYMSDLISHGLLYFPDPKRFNDPFECRPNWRYPSQVKDQRKLEARLKKIAKKMIGSKREARRVSSSAMRDRTKLESDIRQSATKAFLGTRICCFSEKNENILMWSHYADGHKGICIGFDASVPPICLAMKVSYQDIYPEIDYPSHQDERGFDSVLTKSTLWSYESEYRTILVPRAERQPINNGESCVLPKGAITDIYLGALISDPHADFVRGLIDQSKEKPRLWRARLSETSFSLTFESIPLKETCNHPLELPNAGSIN